MPSILKKAMAIFKQGDESQEEIKEDNNSEFETKPQKDIPGRPSLKHQRKRSNSKTPTKDFKVDKHLAKSKDP
jgi:hypothetical protein